MTETKSDCGQVKLQSVIYQIDQHSTENKVDGME